MSYQIVTVGAKILDKDLSVNGVDYYIDKIHVYVRKLAHMAVYFCLAVAISFPLYVYGLRGFPLLIVAGLICFGFACTDEYHQSLVAGRGPSKRDVAIDCVGAFFGITLVRIVCYTALLGSSDGKKKNTGKEEALTDLLLTFLLFSVKMLLVHIFSTNHILRKGRYT